MNDVFLILLLLTDFALLGMSRMAACIRMVAAQGILLGIMTFTAHWPAVSVHTLALGAGSILLKGLVFPRLLFRTIREASVRREIEPILGYNASLIAGIGALGVAFLLSRRLPIAHSHAGALMMPVTFCTIQIGLLLIIARKKAINQVLGYLALENGIFCLGISLSHHAPVLVELGILLDVFAAVFLMGITIFHIQRDFDDIDTSRLTALKE